MGSSILASLSEAGGNNPHRVVSKPLPPHSLRSADRFRSERDPHPRIEQACGPNNGLTKNRYVAANMAFRGARRTGIPPLADQIGNDYPGVGAGAFLSESSARIIDMLAGWTAAQCVARETFRRFSNLNVSSGSNIGIRVSGVLLVKLEFSAIMVAVSANTL